jgi:hypothetical protein
LIQLPMNTSIARLSSPGNAAPTMPLANLAHGLSLLVVESVTPGSRVLVCSVEVVGVVRAAREAVPPAGFWTCVVRRLR